MASNGTRAGVKANYMGLDDVSKRSYSNEMNKRALSKQKATLGSIQLQYHESIVECQLFQRGRCHYGQQCKYAHIHKAEIVSSNSTTAGGNNRNLYPIQSRDSPSRDGVSLIDVGVKEASRNIEAGNVYPVRVGAADCQYYLKTGKCNYGLRCKFNHPFRDENLVNALNRRDCFDFVQKGTCPYGKTCKYNHPDSSKSHEWKEEKQSNSSSDSSRSSPRSVSKSNQIGARKEDIELPVHDLVFQKTPENSMERKQISDGITDFLRTGRLQSSFSSSVNSSQPISSQVHVPQKTNSYIQPEQAIRTLLEFPPNLEWDTHVKRDRNTQESSLRQSNPASTSTRRVSVADRGHMPVESSYERRRQSFPEITERGLEGTTVDSVMKDSVTSQPWTSIGPASDVHKSHTLNIGETTSRTRNLGKGIQQSTPELLHSSIWSLEMNFGDIDQSYCASTTPGSKIDTCGERFGERHVPELMKFTQKQPPASSGLMPWSRMNDISSSSSTRSGLQKLNEANQSTASAPVIFNPLSRNAQNVYPFLPDNSVSMNQYLMQSFGNDASYQLGDSYQLFGQVSEYGGLLRQDHLHDGSRSSSHPPPMGGIQTSLVGGRRHLTSEAQMRKNYMNTAALIDDVGSRQISEKFGNNLSVVDETSAGSRHARTFSDPFSSSSVWKPSDQSSEYGPGLFGMQHTSF